jgi:hypothetical protein
LFSRPATDGQGNETAEATVTVVNGKPDEASQGLLDLLIASGWIDAGSHAATANIYENVVKNFTDYTTEKVSVVLNDKGEFDDELQAGVRAKIRDNWFMKDVTSESYIFTRDLGAMPQMGKGKFYVYKVRFVYGNLSAESGPSIPVTSVAGVFKFERLVNLILVVAFISVACYFMFAARRGKEMYVRPIAGLAAVEEAVGRATEMGRPVMYIPGIGGVGGAATLASIAILSKVAEKTAEYQTDFIMPNIDVFVLQIAQETVREAYTRAGRPDAYSQEMAFFLSDQQFAYAAGVSGLMSRRKPAAVFLLGTFMAESLIMAEAGANIGAIQIAGTDVDTQLPFFVTACDYTLIGEELYAAGAYLSRDPKLLGTLKTQDGFKMIVMILLTIMVPLVVVLLALGVLDVGQFLKNVFGNDFLLMGH